MVLWYGCTRDAGRNQWVWSLTRSMIKRKSSVDQEIKGCFKAGSSDREQILVIKNFDRRCRWKYRVHGGDYPLHTFCTVIAMSYRLGANILQSLFNIAGKFCAPPHRWCGLCYLITFKISYFICVTSSIQCFGRELTQTLLILDLFSGRPDLLVKQTRSLRLL